MQKHIKNALKNPLFTGSFFLFSGGLLANFFNFLFNLLMSRNLMVEEYGLLTSIVSLITLLAIPAGAVTPTVVSAAGDYFANNNTSHLHAFYIKLFKPLAISGILLLVLFFIFSRQAEEFFNIQNPLLFFIAIICVLISYATTLNNSFAQANLAFRYLSFSNTVASFVKVGSAFILVIMGWGLYGAISGYVVSSLVLLIFGIYYLRNVIFYKSANIPSISYKELISFGIPSAVVIFCLNAFISNDILLVKHLFSAYQTGQYAGLSLVGRVIFYISAPISTVMFPILINRYASKKNYKGVLYLSILIVGAACLAITGFYALFPNFAILFFLKNKEYLAISQYLPLFGVFITLYSILSLFGYYFLSIKKTNFAWILLVGTVLQSVLIYLFHADFGQIIYSSIIVTGGLLCISLYLLKTQK